MSGLVVSPSFPGSALRARTNVWHGQGPSGRADLILGTRRAGVRFLVSADAGRRSALSTINYRVVLCRWCRAVPSNLVAGNHSIACALRLVPTQPVTNFWGWQMSNSYILALRTGNTTPTGCGEAYSSAIWTTSLYLPLAVNPVRYTPHIRHRRVGVAYMVPRIVFAWLDIISV